MIRTVCTDEDHFAFNIKNKQEGQQNKKEAHNTIPRNREGSWAGAVGMGVLRGAQMLKKNTVFTYIYLFCLIYVDVLLKFISGHHLHA